MSIIFHSSRAILFLFAIWQALFGGGGSGGGDRQPPVAAAVAGAGGKAFLSLDSAQSTFLIKVRDLTLLLNLEQYIYKSGSPSFSLYPVFCIAFRWYGSQSSQSKSR
jgi:hypothetical protein